MRRWLGAAALTCVAVSAPSSVRGETLALDADLDLPGTKLLAVEFFATWCKPCLEAVPRWEALRRKYARQGLRLVVVAVKDDINRCNDVPWAPDAIICDDEGRLAKRFGVRQLPAAFLWDWQGHLLASQAGVAEVETRVEGWMQANPRVDIAVSLRQKEAGLGPKLFAASWPRRLQRPES
ncbi:MAG: TlpA disulfide reductase family protein [Myxococcota bacterium]